MWMPLHLKIEKELETETWHSNNSIYELSTGTKRFGFTEV